MFSHCVLRCTPSLHCPKMEVNSKPTSSENAELFLAKFDGGAIYLDRGRYSDGIAFIYIDHPEKRNAISGKMMVDLRRCLEELESWTDGKVLIFTSTGNNFCSGGDLSLVTEAGDSHGGLLMSRYMHETLIRFRQLPLVTVTLAHGATIGGGAELTLFTDYIVMADNIRFGFVQAKMGIITAWGGTTRLVEILGRRRSMEMLLSHKIYNAEECLTLGLAYKVVDGDNRLDETLAFAKELSAAAVSILRTYKAVMNNSVRDSFEDSLKFEREMFHPMWGNDTQRSAVRNKLKHINSSTGHKGTR